MSAAVTPAVTASPELAETVEPRMDRRNAAATLAVLVITGAVIMAAAYFANPQVAATTSGEFTAVTVDGQPAGAAPVVDQPAPDFIATTADGSSIRLSELRGKPVWLTFGASWCQPCRAENPDIEATYTAFGGAVTVVQVYMDEDAAAVNDYASRVGVTYTAVPDPNERLAAEYRILGIPSHFFIDSTGVLRQMKVGSLSPDAMKSALDQLQ